MDIYIASENPAKVAAVKQLFRPEDHYNVIAKPVSSGVSAQPGSEEETLKGAVNRAHTLVHQFGAPVGIGLEGGITELGGVMYLCNWGALAVESGAFFTAGGARIPLPDEVSVLIKKGEELGDVIDQYASRSGVRYREGTVGVLTGGAVTRDDMFAHVVKLLFGQWKRNL
ncbi:inosine/xanthosine triphosphatase [Alteribacter lacisalsi]|uniref:inosine/xanthosine triphosphatase n=1 Tax=Alteribacter lacisalsi TaxID=2045244 RepID=A0A2W0HK23_9BACI|nr:DUF84 family protein [Alteribacter lacisalsi]PYZ97159.1 inosine/xanthosine triphosphatase [Alteribacter lacisalsi]